MRRPPKSPCRRRRPGDREIGPGLRRRADQGLVRVAGLDRIHDVGARRHDLFDPIAGLEFEILDEAEKQRIGHCHGKKVLLEPHRHAHSLERHIFRDQDHRGRIGRVLNEVAVGEAELEGERFGDLLFRGEVHPHEHDTNAFAGALVLVERGAEVVFRDEARLDQALTDFFTHPGSSATRVRGEAEFRL